MVLPPQPRVLSQSASAPALTHQPSKNDFNKGSATRPGRNQQAMTATGTTALALYAAPSFSSLYVEPEDLDPGPGAYDLAPSLGFQHESTKDSGPALSLTAKHDKSWAKVMITKEHMKAFKAKDTPGPGTYQPEQVASQSRVRFGTDKRMQLAETKFRAPGPVYETRTAPDVVPSKTKFGKANRFERDGDSLSASLGNTGPGMYEVATDFDGQKLAKSFGASHRAYDKVRFPGSERTMVGRASPGPGAMRDFHNDGSKMSMGRAERLPANSIGKRSPGPGAYDHEKPPPFSRSQSVYSFGRPHARSRLDHKQLRHLSNSTWGYL